MTITQALRIASQAVTIVGQEIILPRDWYNLRGTTTAHSITEPGTRETTAQQQRAESIAMGMAILLELDEAVELGCYVQAGDAGGQRGALQILQRAMREAVRS